MVDVVGENTKRRRLMIVAVFTATLMYTNSGKKIYLEPIWRFFGLKPATVKQ